MAKSEPLITQQQRLAHITRLLDPGADLVANDRVAALLLLLHGQPLVRIARMRLEQLTVTETAITVAFTSDTLTIPPPFDQIIHALPNQSTSAHRDNRWLFPDRRPGRHVNQSPVDSENCQTADLSDPVSTNTTHTKNPPVTNPPGHHLRFARRCDVVHAPSLTSPSDQV